MDTELFKEKLKEKTIDAERIVKLYLPKEEGNQKKVIEAMNYSILVGGKRIRPVLMKEAYLMFGGDDEKVIGPFMAALEMIHNYSLIHDDLPALDNDEYRRGKKTCHAVYGAGMATIAGDGLLNFAYETAFKAGLSNAKLTDFDGEVNNRILAALQILGKKAGIYGMVGGQCADIEAEKRKDLTREELIFIHENKTGALIEAALMIGALLAGADFKDVQAMEKVGSNVGIAFQIQDDILDVVGDEATLGKPVGSDAKNEKTTYVNLFGIEKSRQDVSNLSNEAVSLLNDLANKKSVDDPFLKDLILSMINRVK